MEDALNTSAPSDDQIRGARVTCRNLWKIYGQRPEAHLERLVTARPGDEPVDEGHTVAVRDVSFELEPGETFVVMGLSGSGKSTLIRCLTRLIEPTSGSVSFDDRSVTDMTAAELRELRRQDCAMVFQHFGLLPHRRVIDNVAYGLEVAGMRRKEREARAQEMLQLVGLSDSAKRYPVELSGGMRQRVGLARALAVGPRVLLLDEPFSALDPLIRRELQDELVRLALVLKQTVIFITHDMTEALKVGHLIAVMRDGRFVQVGTPDEIVLQPADDYVRRFSEHAPRLRAVQAASFAAKAMTVSVEATVGEALRRMGNSPYGFIVDADGRPEAVLSLSDLRGSADPSRPARDVATRPIATVLETSPLQQAVRPLADQPTAVAVVDGRGAITGAIDRGHLLHALVESA